LRAAQPQPDHGLDSAWKLDEHAIAGRFYDAAAMCFDRGVDDGSPQLPQTAQRSGLILADQAAIADHVGGKNGSKPAFRASRHPIALNVRCWVTVYLQ
jgi:hypothetical protein